MRKQRSFLHGCLFNNSEEVKRGKGKNLIPPPEKESLWKAYMEKFRDPLIIVLLVVFCFSVIVSLYEVFYQHQGYSMLIEPLGILIALILATGVGFIFEVKADKEFDILNQVKNRRPIKVFRKYQDKIKDRIRICEVEKHDVCVGDFVFLENGDEIPADGYLYETNDFLVDESNFTGEPYVRKSAYQEEFKADATFPTNKVLRGSTVIDGNAIFKVEKIGMDTEEGRGVAKTQEGKDVETPLNIQLDKLGSLISKISFIIAIFVVVGRMVYFFGFTGEELHDFVHTAEFLLSSIMLAVTLIVVAVPEGLPMSVTVSLALSMRKMLKENNLVRKLHACETMGATTVICTDKTGTLTQNKMSVMAHKYFGNDAERNVRYNIALNSTAEISMNENQKPVGNPTEGALLTWLADIGINYDNYRHAYIWGDSLPFSPIKKYMQTEFYARGLDDFESPKEHETYQEIQKGNERHLRFVKGAPEIILNMCEKVGGDVSELEILSTLKVYQEKAMRTLAFASQYEIDGTWSPLTFDGIVGIADPIREDVKGAIEDCTQKAGVRVIIITGDTPGTASEIGKQIGLINDESITITGDKFAALSDEEAKELVKNPHFKIISRAKPDDKARLVTLLQQVGEVVAVTGDGTNDAPALSKAQVGLSMGDGTSRAKEASDITIINNSFVSIKRAIIWGRSLYLNIQRFILFQMTINICACLIVLIGACTGLDSPLTVTQMLWVNLIMDTFAAMALSSLPADEKVLNAPPRKPNAFIIDRRMLSRIMWVGLFFFVILFGLWQLLWHQDIMPDSGIASLLTRDTAQAAIDGYFDLSKKAPHMSSYEMGVFFTVFVVMQFWNLFNAKYFRTGRSLLQDIFELFVHPQKVIETYSKGFLLIVVVILLGQVLIVNGVGELFSVSPLPMKDWLYVIIGTSPILIVPDIIRSVRHFILRIKQ